ncbi:MULTISPECIES: 2'-5' RNA ligase family protein [unclassified Paenibacillus]|uniref:2'-5' RNA ligase family protein n=1 Tax=unclassified Paenibacillus TaxID=185978 RepID=UPI0036450611
MLYGIAVFPSQEIKEFANHYRRRYDPQFASIEPHLTLRAREDWTEEQLHKVHSHLKHVTAACKPLELHFNRFSTFFPVNNVIYMALSDPEPLEALYNLLCSGVLEEMNKPYAFTPHLTVAQNLDDDELHDVFASLRPKSLDMGCTIDRIMLLKLSDDGIWQPLEQFALGV